MGIGTSTPEAKLHVSEDSISITTVRIESAATTSGTSLVDFWPDTFQSAFVVGATNGGSNYPANHALLWGNLSMPMAFATDNQMRMAVSYTHLTLPTNRGV